MGQKIDALHKAQRGYYEIYVFIQQIQIWRTLRATDDSAFAVREHAGHTMKVSMENAVALDTRDRPILATKGLLVRGSQELAGAFGDSSFVRHQFDFQVKKIISIRYLY